MTAPASKESDRERGMKEAVIQGYKFKDGLEEIIRKSPIKDMSPIVGSNIELSKGFANFAQMKSGEKDVYGGFHRPDGIIEKASHTELEYDQRKEETFTIVESWIDSNGNKYYKMKNKTGIQEFYTLWRINETDSVLEIVRSNVDYPSEIDPNRYWYKIFYRQ